MLADTGFLLLLRMGERLIRSRTCMRMICLVVTVVAAVAKTLCFQHIPGQIVQWYHLFQTMADPTGFEPATSPLMGGALPKLRYRSVLSAAEETGPAFPLCRRLR